MKKLEENSKKTFIVTIIIYLIYKIYMSINALGTNFKDIPGAQEELKTAGQSGKVIVIMASIVTIALFIFLTYIICKSIFKNINVDNPKMLERFSGIYFSNMTVLYIFSIIISLFNNYLPEIPWIKFTIIGVVKILIAIGFNMILLDNDEDSEIKMVPNIILFAVVFLF